RTLDGSTLKFAGKTRRCRSVTSGASAGPSGCEIQPSASGQRWKTTPGPETFYPDPVSDEFGTARRAAQPDPAARQERIQHVEWTCPAGIARVSSYGAVRGSLCRDGRRDSSAARARSGGTARGLQPADAAVSVASGARHVHAS